MAKITKDFEVRWGCPDCKNTNTDYYDLTAEPLCGLCDKHFTWEYLLTIGQQNHLNDQLKAENSNPSVTQTDK